MAMISLTPGPLFSGAGFNRTSTPLGPRATPTEIRAAFQRESFHEEMDWPPDSPVAKVYDVKNSPSSLIILNNKHQQKRLRGYDNHQPSPPDPERHSDTGKRNECRHSGCMDSGSPPFEAKPKVKQMWLNQNQRPPWTPAENNFTNPSRHRSCRISSDPATLSLEHSKMRKSAGVQRTDRKAPISMKDNAALIHPDLSASNKKYMYFISKTYDVTNLKQLKQLQYRDILLRQQYLGYHTDDEYRKYMKYLEGPRKRTFGESGPLFKSGHRSRPQSSIGTQSVRSSHSEIVSEHDTDSRVLSSRSSYTSSSPPRNKSNRPKTSQPSKSQHKEKQKHDNDRDASPKSHRKSPRALSPRSKKSMTREHLRKLAKEKQDNKTPRREEKHQQDHCDDDKESLASSRSSKSSKSDKTERENEKVEDKEAKEDIDPKEAAATEESDINIRGERKDSDTESKTLEKNDGDVPHTEENKESSIEAPCDEPTEKREEVVVKKERKIWDMDDKLGHNDAKDNDSHTDEPTDADNGNIMKDKKYGEVEVKTKLSSSSSSLSSNESTGSMKQAKSNDNVETEDKKKSKDVMTNNDKVKPDEFSSTKDDRTVKIDEQVETRDNDTVHKIEEENTNDSSYYENEPEPTMKTDEDKQKEENQTEDEQDKNFNPKIVISHTKNKDSEYGDSGSEISIEIHRKTKNDIDDDMIANRDSETESIGKDSNILPEAANYLGKYSPRNSDTDSVANSEILPDAPNYEGKYSPGNEDSDAEAKANVDILQELPNNTGNNEGKYSPRNEDSDAETKSNADILQELANYTGGDSPQSDTENEQCDNKTAHEQSEDDATSVSSSVILPEAAIYTGKYSPLPPYNPSNEPEKETLPEKKLPSKEELKDGKLTIYFKKIDGHEKDKADQTSDTNKEAPAKIETNVDNKKDTISITSMPEKNTESDTDSKPNILENNTAHSVDENNELKGSSNEEITKKDGKNMSENYEGSDSNSDNDSSSSDESTKNKAENQNKTLQDDVMKQLEVYEEVMNQNEASQDETSPRDLSKKTANNEDKNNENQNEETISVSNQLAVNEEITLNNDTTCDKPAENTTDNSYKSESQDVKSETSENMSDTFPTEKFQKLPESEEIVLDNENTTENSTVQKQEHKEVTGSTDYGGNNLSESEEPEKQPEETVKQSTELDKGEQHSQSSLSSSDELEKSAHKEGVDRPKTRLGRPKTAADGERSVSSSSEEDLDVLSASFYREGVDRPKSRAGRKMPETAKVNSDDGTSDPENPAGSDKLRQSQLI